MDDPPDRGYSRAPELERIGDVDIPVASKQLLIVMKNTIRESDQADVRLLRARIEEENR